jgi:hypothetical protein
MAAVSVAARRQEHGGRQLVEDVMEHLPPKEARVREGLVNKKIAAGETGYRLVRHLHSQTYIRMSHSQTYILLHIRMSHILACVLTAIVVSGE